MSSNNVMSGKIKGEIQRLAESGHLHEAKEMVQQYRLINPTDKELFSIEAVVDLMAGNLTSAEQVMRMGMVLNKEDPDIWFNFGYLNELKGRTDEAVECYKEAKGKADSELKKQIDNILENLLNAEGHKINAEANESLREPLVSILIPTYNMKEYLKETIDSVLAQDFEDLEVVIGDDGSMDGTDILMEHYKYNKKIRYIRNDRNLGPSENSRKLLYEHAKGTYVLGINHDDYLIQTDYIRNAVSILEANPNVTLVFANVNYKNMQTGQEGKGTDLDINGPINGIEYFYNYQTSEYPPIPSTLSSVYRRRDAIKMGCLLEEVYSQDTFLYLKLMLLGDVAFIKDHVGVYRVHDKSLTRNMPVGNEMLTIREFERLYSFAAAMELNKAKLDVWLQIRVLNYMRWRLAVLWSVNKKYALKILLEISEKYENVFNSIAASLQLFNK